LLISILLFANIDFLCVKSLAKAAEIIRNGAERMKQRDSEENDDVLPQVQPLRQDYYTELMRLRQKWKVKKIGNMITGDLSYKSAGSTFWHRGLFEVLKTEDLPEDERSSSLCPLTVRVSSDLEGHSRIRVKISDSTEAEDMDVDDKHQGSNSVQAQNLNGHASNIDSPHPSPWQKTLKQAQYNLFCKELFSQISREAFHSKNVNSVQVSGKTIRLQLYPTAFAEIIYEKTSKDEGISYEALLSGNGDVLEFRLQKLLHEQHLSRVDTPTPQPANAPWTTRDHTIANLQDFFAKKNAAFIPRAPLLLDEFYDELKHVVLRKRTNNLLHQMATTHRDPSIAVEWSANAGPKTSFANIHMFSKRQKLCYRTSFHFRIELDKIEAVNMTGKTVSMSGELEDVQEYVKMQVSLHFAHVALGIFENFEWKILQHPNDIGMDMQDQSFHLKARSSSHECSLALSVYPDYSFHIHTQKALAADEDPNLTTILDTRWTRVEGKATSIDWKALPGFSFADKFYGLVASLS